MTDSRFIHITPEDPVLFLLWMSNIPLYFSYDQASGLWSIAKCKWLVSPVFGRWSQEGMVRACDWECIALPAVPAHLSWRQRRGQGQVSAGLGSGEVSFVLFLSIFLSFCGFSIGGTMLASLLLLEQVRHTPTLGAFVLAILFAWNAFPLDICIPFVKAIQMLPFQRSQLYHPS